MDVRDTPSPAGVKSSEVREPYVGSLRAVSSLFSAMSHQNLVSKHSLVQNEGYQRRMHNVTRRFRISKHDRDDDLYKVLNFCAVFEFISGL